MDEQQRLYEQIVSNMATGVYLLRVSDGKIVFANSKVEKLFAYEHKELLGMHLTDLIVPTDHTPQQTTNQIFKALTDTGEWHGEINHIKKDGTTFWCYTDISTFDHLIFGKVFVVVHTDITNNVAKRNKLLEAQLLLQSSIESTKDLIILSIDKNFKYLFFNETHRTVMKNVYGVDVKIGMNILDCIPKKRDRDLAKSCYTRALGGENYTKINEYGEESKRLCYETNYNPIYNANHEIIGATAFAKEITDRRRMEMSLKESEERYKKLSDLTLEAIIIHKNGTAIDVNKAFESIVGYSREEMIGKNLIEYIVKEEFRGIARRNMTENISGQYEVVVKRKDGAFIPIEIGGQRQINSNGDTVFVTIARDLSQNRKNELKVKRSEADLVSQIENTDDSIWSVDKNYIITIANSVFLRTFFLAFNHELRLGDRVLDYLPDSLISVWKKRYDKVFNGHRFSMIDEFDYENVPQYVETAFNPVIVDDEIVGAACFSKDITQQKLVEKELKSSEEKFKVLSELSPGSISIHGIDKYLYVNKAWELLTEYSREEALKMSPFDIVHPDMKDEVIKRAEKRLKGEKVPKRYDLKILTKSNHVKWVDISFSVIQYDNQTVSMGVCFDNTELKEAKEDLIISKNQLKEANATKDKFFSIISHDLRSPFSAIIGFSDLLKSEYYNLSDSERVFYINQLSSTSYHTLSLLENLLNWARAQQGGITIHKVPLHLKTFIHRVIELSKLNIIQKNIEINVHVSDDIMVMADEYSIMTVLRNLFNNAIKYTPNGGHIEIEVHESEKDITFLISDSGVGMSREAIDKLFRLKESFSTKGTNKETGTGLGLILCKEFIELNGGSMSVQSKEGLGSTFSFKIPKQL